MSLFMFYCKECGLQSEPCSHYLQHETIRLLREEMKFNRHALCEIIHSLNQLIATLRHPTGLAIFQLGNQENHMSTAPGGTSVFQEVPTPTGSVFPAGTTFTWTVDDTADITLTPSTDTTQCTAVCVATPTGTSYNLTCTSSYTPTGATVPVGGTLNVPIGTTTITPTGLTINQLS